MIAPGLALSLTSAHAHWPMNTRDIELFHNLTFHQKHGEFLSIVGASGCGKSTLLRWIAGYPMPQSFQPHTIQRDNSLGIGMVFQDPQLFSWRTVYDNIALPLELKNIDKTSIRSRVEEMLSIVELDHAASLTPQQCSGGMKMRVALARALIDRPKLLLLDEPFAALDEVLRLRLSEFVRKTTKSSQCAVLLVTHSISEAAYISDRILVLGGRPGRITHEEFVQLPDERSLTDKERPEYSRSVNKLFHYLETAQIQRENAP